MFSRCVDIIFDCIWVVRLSYFYVKEYERTGYVWEQYNANTGEGQRRSVIRTYSETLDS